MDSASTLGNRTESWRLLDNKGRRMAGLAPFILLDTGIDQCFAMLASRTCCVEYEDAALKTHYTLACTQFWPVL